LVEAKEDISNWAVMSKALTHVFEVAFQEGLKDFPLCRDCTAKVDAAQGEKLKQMQREKDLYKNLLESFSVSAGLEDVSSEEEVLLAKEEKELQAHLERLRMEKREIKEKIDALNTSRIRFEAAHDQFWTEIADLEVNLKKISTEHHSYKKKIEALELEYSLLKRTNVYEDAFHISHDGHFATINGFRLGKLPSQPVQWSEINAALGQSVLLLDSIAHAVNFEFSKYKLMPRGSFSRIAKKTETTAHEL
jgi:beclin 1